jgi:hypothetical protein
MFVALIRDEIDWAGLRAIVLKAKRLLSTLLIFPKPARQTKYRLNYRATQQFPAVPPGRLTALLGLRELHLL